MANITIHLQQETQQCLAQKARQGGQTLEEYLERLVHEHIQTEGDTNAPSGEAMDDEFGERPWRGVFVPPRPRDVLFSDDLSLRADELPKREPSLNMRWHRMVTDDE